MKIFVTCIVLVQYYYQNSHYACKLVVLVAATDVNDTDIRVNVADVFWINTKFLLIIFTTTYFISRVALRILTGEKDRQENSSAFEKYEYGHLSSWYIMLTLYNRFSNWNKILVK